jgi:hypothetical protein
LNRRLPSTSSRPNVRPATIQPPSKSWSRITSRTTGAIHSDKPSAKTHVHVSPAYSDHAGEHAAREGAGRGETNSRTAPSPSPRHRCLETPYSPPP